MKKLFLRLKKAVRRLADDFELAIVDSKLAELDREPDEAGSHGTLAILYEGARAEILARIEARENQGVVTN